MRNKEFVRLELERLEQRDNPSSGWSFWEDTYVGAFLSGLGEGAVNIAIGARDAVVEVVRTGGDLVTVWSNWNNINPSRLNSKLFQGVIETADDSAAAASYERQLVFGIATLGGAPLVESGYNAIITGDSTEFSQQAGGFGVMTLVPSTGVKVLNKLPNVPIRLPMPTAGGVMLGADGTLMVVPSGIAWAEVGVIPLAVPAETATAIATTGSIMAMTVTNPGGSGGVDPVKFVGAQAITSPHLPAGTYCALVVDGKVYVARMHTICYELAGKKGYVQFYGSAQIDAAGTVVRLF
jgi:hypothetical protein